MALIELVDYNETLLADSNASKGSEKKTTRRSRGGAKKSAPTSEATSTEATETSEEQAAE